MANYTYTQNGITFDDIKAPLIATGGITVGNKYSTNAFTGELNSITVDATNAVSIDWNGAQLGDKEINTIGNYCHINFANGLRAEIISQSLAKQNITYYE